MSDSRLGMFLGRGRERLRIAKKDEARVFYLCETGRAYGAGCIKLLSLLDVEGKGVFESCKV